MATAANTPRRSRLRPRFSLRVLLLAVTAFAIGFPIWYRWPYEEETLLDISPVAQEKRFTTWQRKWGGGRVRQGVERIYSRGTDVETTTYRNDVKHGPFKFDGGNGYCYEGQYVDGEMHGVWIRTFPDGQQYKESW